MLDVVEDKLVVEEKGIYSIEKFLIARRLMYWQVYLHKTVVAAENMLIKTLERAKFLLRRNNNIFTTPSLHFFLTHNWTIKDLKSDLNFLDNFSQLDDYDIYTCLKAWQNSSDFVLSNLSKRIINRNILKIKLYKKSIPKNKENSLINDFSIKHNCSKEESKFFIFSNKISNSTYNITKSNINILMKKGEVNDITRASDQINNEVLNRTVNKYFLCYVNE